jgi:hypothetical protein
MERIYSCVEKIFLEIINKIVLKSVKENVRHFRGQEINVIVFD